MLFRLLKRKVAHLLVKWYDPLVNLQLGNQEIKVNLSHQLRDIVKVYPQYNHNLGRIVGYTEAVRGKISVIDIGANVGDTVAFIRNTSEAPILCIDGEEKYVEILKTNVQQYKDISICHTLVGKENKSENVKLKVEKGTAHIEFSNKPVTVRTLENILEEFPRFKESKVLKTDTDGFDTWILRSCSSFLKTVKPILFFEFDPYFIKANNDDPFEFIDYLKSIGYKYLIFYTNIGDLLLSCSMEDTKTIHQIVHFFSGREVEMFADICAFMEEDKDIFIYSVEHEIQHYREVRKY